MTAINWPHCAGQRRVKEVLEASVADGSLAHAYLFSGMEGCGKFAAALDLALILLCEDKNNRPCMKCDSCIKVLHYAHPDFHVVIPVDLPREFKGKDDDDNEDSNNEEGIKKSGKEEKKWEFISERIKDMINDVYGRTEFEKKPDIPVVWIRELAHAILRGTLGKKVNIGIFDCVDLMKDSTANSMLKLLEEPPAGTVLLLLTERPSAVLPTIVSRCQKLRFSWCSPEEIRTALCGRFSVSPSDPRLDAVLNTGSLGRSIFLWNNPSDEVRKEAETLWDQCLRKNWQEIGGSIDRLIENGDYSIYEQLFLEVLQRVRNVYFRELGFTENLFSGDRLGTFPHAAGLRLLELCERSIAAVKARANMTLVLAHFAITLTETLNGEKQQPC
jgi:DNA polymerase III subunit delta'